MSDHEAREEVIKEIAEHLAAENPGRRHFVAIDGITAAGKTTLARELTGAIHVAGRSAAHISTDDYHNVASTRREDPDRAGGYYRNAYNFDALIRLVLQPLHPDGEGKFVPRHHNVFTDEVLPEEHETVASDAVVIVDGSFLQKPPLRGKWDCVIWIDTSFGMAEKRAVDRDQEIFGSEQAVCENFQQRYHPGCQIYIEELDPMRCADVIVHNEDIKNPTITWRKA